MTDAEIQKKLDAVTETAGGYPVKDLVYHGKNRKYIGGLVKDPLRKGTSISEGYSGTGWDVKGKALTRHPSSNKERPDLNIKF